MLETQKQIFSVVMPMDIAQRARVVAAMQGRSRSRLLCEILTDYLKQYDAKPKAALLAEDPKPNNEGGNDATV